jgi:hypothetical protein
VSLAIGHKLNWICCHTAMLYSKKFRSPFYKIDHLFN